MNALIQTPPLVHAIPLDVAEFARMEERRQAAGVSCVADEWEEIAGGRICFAGVGSWANQAMGLGMEGPVAEADLDRLVDFFESRGVEPRIEVCPLAHPSLVEGLAARRFLLREFETVLAFDLERQPLPPLPAGVRMRAVDPAAEEERSLYSSILREGFAPPDAAMAERMERRYLVAPGVKALLAEVDGEAAGAGTVDASPPCAMLFGAATREGFRRRGVQTALMIARLELAREAGCRYAAVHSRPDVATGRNALRLGFRTVYTKVVMTRPGGGLASSP
ncbi:MAG TPA: GNAT family N-acetyltransferase [Pirellulaceae bacterium]|jgi:GNAT superfamily N-acetyltransferase|nr:GNAT family N-acetyltransferase [Pirellulaceae bacterium]